MVGGCRVGAGTMAGEGWGWGGVGWVGFQPMREK